MQNLVALIEDQLYCISGLNASDNDYQVAGNDRVERRLRWLTPISAITLPLGLIAGLLGMNVGGVPGTTLASGFLIVSGLMVLIVLAEYWYFRRTGWFD